MERSVTVMRNKESFKKRRFSLLTESMAKNSVRLKILKLRQIRYLNWFFKKSANTHSVEIAEILSSLCGNLKIFPSRFFLQKFRQINFFTIRHSVEK